MHGDKGEPLGIVFSTKHGRMCPTCGQAVEHCACARAERLPHGDGIVRVSRETKGRKGKGVTLISGILLERAKLRSLATELKRQCGAGGTVKADVIQIQGDHRDHLIAVLEKMGYSVKRAGG